MRRTLPSPNPFVYLLVGTYKKNAHVQVREPSSKLHTVFSRTNSPADENTSGVRFDYLDRHCDDSHTPNQEESKKKNKKLPSFIPVAA